MLGKKKNHQNATTQTRERNRDGAMRARETRVQHSPSQVFSYHANRSARQADFGRTAPEPATKKRYLRPRRLHIGASQIVPTLIVLVLGLMCLNLSTRPKIVTLGATTGGQVFLRSPATYQQAAQKLFASSLLNANKLTVDTTHITQTLEQEFPELEAASISLPVLGRQPIVYMQPAMPELILQTNRGQAFVVDNHGRALINTSAALGVAQLHIPTVADKSGLQIQPGVVVLPSESASFIGQLAQQFRAKAIPVSAYDLTSGGNELDAHLANASYIVKYNLRGDVREQAGAFFATKQLLDSQRKAPAQYVDVRVPGKVFYK